MVFKCIRSLDLIYGGFGEGVWQRKGNRWSIKATGVLPHGKKSSSVKTP